MNAPEGPAAPASGTATDLAIPSFDELEEDPEIGSLLNFEPVVRKVKRPDGWTPELQCELIARIAACGSPTRAAQQMGKNVSGAEGVYRSPGAESFRAAWDAALALWQQRSAEAARGAQAVGRAPGLNVRGGRNTSPGLLPGQVINEFGEWEDEAALERRADEARDSVSRKLINARRLYLNEISDSPGKRAAFELLTVLPIDWERAERLQPQPDEPWRNPNMREPEMLLTAEAGWLGGELVHGPDKQAQLREAIDEHRQQEGLPPVEWD